MISGCKKVRIRRYLPMSHGNEVYNFVEPKDGEEFWGIPYGFCSENSYPYIVYMKDGKEFVTINALDVSEIEFW